jgi:hypothetical protein
MQMFASLALPALAQFAPLPGPLPPAIPTIHHAIYCAAPSTRSNPQRSLRSLVEYPAHGAVYGDVADAVQEFLAGPASFWFSELVLVADFNQFERIG